jgi:hypothetical protein
MSTTTLLNALLPGPLSDAIVAAVGPDATVHTLRDETFAPCVGCFECWVKTPGRCKARDAANGVMTDILRGGLQVWASPVRFGTWDPSAKKALDKCIGLLSPFFAEVEGETHHAPRYDSYPRFLAVGVLADDAPAADAELFAELVAREALNFLSPARGVLIVREGDDAEQVEAQVRAAIHRVLVDAARPMPAHVPPRMPRGPGVSPLPDRPRRVLLLIGSVKPAGTSTSERLGNSLIRRLRECGWETAIEHVGSIVHLERAPTPRFLEVTGRADLIVLATPIYVDTLGALATQALSQLGDAGGHFALMGMFQCGFPEVEHTWLAPRVLESACRAHGWTWVGAISAGGAALYPQPGEISGHEEGLDLAAAALDAGSCLTDEIAEKCARPVLSPRVYRTLGAAGWIAQSWQHGTMFRLGARPLGD